MSLRHIPFFDMKAVNAPFMTSIHESLMRTSESGRFIHGEETSALEQALSEIEDGAEVLATSNGTDALRLIAAASLVTGRLKAGDEIIIPSHTYIATALPFTELGFRLRLAEPSTASYCLTDEDVLKTCTTRTKGVVLVHLYGHPSGSPALAEELHSRGIMVIEDCAQAIGAAITLPDGMTIHTGAIGDTAALSFYPTKNIGALGDAGAVASRDKELIAAARALAEYGSDRRYHNIYCGFNCRMDELQAAIILSKLPSLEDINQCRRRKASIYNSNLNNPLVIKPSEPGNGTSVWHQYVVRIKGDRRDDFRTYLASRGIETDVHYPVPFFRQPCYRGVFTGHFPRAEKLAKEIVSLPIASVNDDDLDYICSAINDYE